MNKKIDIHTQEGLEKLKSKAVEYGHYAEFLYVMDLIEEIEYLRKRESQFVELQKSWNEYYSWDEKCPDDIEKKDFLFNEFKYKIRELAD